MLKEVSKEQRPIIVRFIWTTVKLLSGLDLWRFHTLTPDGQDPDNRP
jgi:hypothetical protein